MGAEFGLYYPPWNWTGQPDDLLERVAGEVGIDHVTVPVVTGEVTQFRLCGAFEQPYFHTEGSWHVPPRAKLYRGSVRPPVARWFGKRDVVARICERAQGLGLSVFFRLTVTPVRELGAIEHLRHRNAWGQAITSGEPCIFNPELRELLRATLEDLRRYGPSGFELDGWEADAKLSRETPTLGEWHFLVSGLARICFCASCRQIADRAGLDGEQAARSVRAHVERLDARARDPDARPAEQADDVLKAYRSARDADDGKWLDGLAEVHTEQRCFHIYGLPLWPEERVFTRWLPVLRIPYAFPTLIPKKLAQLSTDKRAPGATMLVWAPTLAESAQFVSLVSGIVSRGVGFLDFEGLEEAPREAVKWLKQAVRKARRE